MARSILARASCGFLVAFAWTACATSAGTGFFPATDGGGGSRSDTGALRGDGATGKDSGQQVLGTADASAGDAGSAACGTSATDLSGCPCPQAGATRPCYPNNVDSKTENVGTCKPGTQKCQAASEFTSWSACTGAVTPAKQDCAGTVDTNCDGKMGCADPSCATDPACMMMGCTDGATRPCYEGPAGTEGVGTCQDGTQVCTNGKWPNNCPGEVLPTPESCCDALDHNCNGLPGCFDFLSCVTNACCAVGCTSSSTLSPGCVCPTGDGDTGTCPIGDHLVPIGSSLLDEQCCPCTASDCDDINCCGYDVCSGSSTCAGIPCMPASSLPASCNGQVSTDCDDWPEDCDEPCCLCSECTDAGQ